MRYFKYFLIFFILLSTQHASAWGYSVHLEVSERAIELLDGDFYDFLVENIDMVKSKSIEPDGFTTSDPAESARHFDDSDIPHQDINISSKTADYELGVVSWAVLNNTYSLADAILANDGNGIIHYAGYLMHYATDSTQPFHATANYNGQLTGNDGIHSKFEVAIVERYFEESFSNTTFQDLTIIDPYNETKKIIASGLTLVDDILKADDEALAGATTQDDYYEAIWLQTSDIMKSRINIAIQHSANLLYTAYQIAVSNGLESFAPVITAPIPVSTPETTVEETPVSLMFWIVLPTFVIIRKSNRK